MKYPLPLSCVSAIGLLLLGDLAVAQPHEQGAIEEVLIQGRLGRYSATKSDTPILETARSVSIETQLDLLDKGVLNLADAYLYTAGVFGEQFGFASRGDWVAVRGLSVPEYRDSLQALFGSYNNTRPDIYTIEQVEVLKGPASVLYGQGSPGGIVNVVSKLPQEEAHREVVAEMGNFNRRQVAADFTGALDADATWLYRLNLVYRDTETQVDLVEENARVIAPSLTWRPSDATNLTALLNLQDSKNDVAEQFTPIYGSLLPAPNGRRIPYSTYHGEPGFNKYDTSSNSLTLLADHQINETWNVESTLRFTDGDSDYAQAWIALMPGDRYVRNPDGSLYKGGLVPRDFYAAKGTSEQLAMDTRARARFTTGVLEHELLMGLMYQHVTTETDSSYMSALGYDFATGAPDAVLGDRFWINAFDPVYSGAIPDQAMLTASLFDAPESTTRDTGFYINDQINIAAWSLLFGLRHDDVETDNGSSVQKDDALSYSVGALYRFENGLSPYLSFAESFQPVVGTDNQTGEQLKPREGEQVEAGLKFQHGSGAFVTLAWFDIEESNLANPNAVVGANSQQEGVSEISGGEIEVFIPWNDFTWESNLSRVDTEDPNGLRFASVPEQQASTWVNWRPTNQWQGFKAGVGLRYIGESWDGADTLRTPSYTLADLMVGYETGNWNATLNVRNLADKEYAATCLARGDCFLGENRTIVARVVHRF